MGRGRLQNPRIAVKRSRYTNRCQGEDCKVLGQASYVPDGVELCDRCLLDEYGLSGRPIDEEGYGDDYIRESEVIAALRRVTQSPQAGEVQALDYGKGKLHVVATREETKKIWPGVLCGSVHTSPWQRPPRLIPLKDTHPQDVCKRCYTEAQKRSLISG